MTNHWGFAMSNRGPGDCNPPTSARRQFGLRSLFGVTLIAALMCAVARWGAAWPGIDPVVFLLAMAPSIAGALISLAFIRVAGERDTVVVWTFVFFGCLLGPCFAWLLMGVVALVWY
jgi:hypothetical protein